MPASDETLTGTIINFHREKGYGFIQCASRPNNVFFHIRNDVDENVVAMIEAIAEETTGWRQLDIPVTFREKWIGKARGHKPAAFDIKPYAPTATAHAFSQ
jgi:cold shock CspA family protein